MPTIITVVIDDKSIVIKEEVDPGSGRKRQFVGQDGYHEDLSDALARLVQLTANAAHREARPPEPDTGAIFALKRAAAAIRCMIIAVFDVSDTQAYTERAGWNRKSLTKLAQDLIVWAHDEETL